MDATVGIFDSGVGGLSVATALHRLRPSLPIRYLADTAYFPYGGRPEHEVTERALVLAQLLIDDGCDLLIVACNPASSAALEALRATYGLPIVGMEPPLKPAVELSVSRRVAVLATPATSAGARLARLRDLYGAGANVAVVPMPGLADLVESGEVAGERVERVLREALALPLREGIDAVVVVGDMVSEDTLVRELRQASPRAEVLAIGDCVAPRYLDAAILEGHRAGRAI